MKPRGIHATFAVDCPRCNGEFTVTNGRIDPHECERASLTVRATHEEVAEGQAFYRDTMARLKTALDNR